MSMSPCHLSIFHHGEREGKSSAYGAVPCAGERTAMERSHRKHQGIRNANPSNATLQRLGMKQETSVHATALLRTQEVIMRTPTIMNNCTPQSTLLSRSFCTYRSSHISPDHLLSGLIRNTIEYASNTLPNVQHRE